MAIDRIGKNAPPASPADRSGISGATPPEPAFEVPVEVRAEGADPVSPPGGPLDLLRAGKINLEGYLDLKVSEATAHLARLPAADLDAIRTALRDRLASDPSLVDLVRTTAMAVPPARDD